MNATREQILDLLRQGKTNTAISRTLGCDRHRVADIRRTENIPNVPAQPLTMEQKWHERTRPVDGGHLVWTGERAASGTPLLRYRTECHTAAQIAFRIRHGRDPHGYVFAECGRRHCVAPDHVDDETTRTQTREQLRYLAGGQVRKERCTHGHDQAEHGRYEADGRAYCRACKNDRKAVLA